MNSSVSVRQALQAALPGLEAATARLEAEILLRNLLGVSRAWLFAHPEARLTDEQQRQFEALVERRQRGEPMAYIIGSREFWSLELEVTADVLIPRPETELLVEQALSRIPTDAAWRIADLGTGSGAIAIALARERPRCEIHATDCSTAALEIARRNALRHDAGRIQFHEGFWLAPVEGRFQAIVSNPPYVAQSDPHLSRGDCRFEPRGALTPGGDGLDAIRHIAGSALPRLTAGGLLALEHGYGQGEATRALLQAAGFVKIETMEDLEGLERVTLASRA